MKQANQKYSTSDQDKTNMRKRAQEKVQKIDIQSETQLLTHSRIRIKF